MCVCVCVFRGDGLERNDFLFYLLIDYYRCTFDKSCKVYE